MQKKEKRKKNTIRETWFLGLRFILIALLSGKRNEARRFYALLVHWSFQFTKVANLLHHLRKGSNTFQIAVSYLGNTHSENFATYIACNSY